MKFMMLVKHVEKFQGDKPVAPPQKLMDEMERIRKEAERAGTMVANGGLAPTAVSSRVRLSGGKVNVIDGPFTESKEVIGGFAILNFNSKEEAVDSARQFMELHRQHWPGWEGETEVRQIFGPEDFTPHK
jgi:hypothetical protein